MLSVVAKDTVSDMVKLGKEIDEFGVGCRRFGETWWRAGTRVPVEWTWPLHSRSRHEFVSVRG